MTTGRAASLTAPAGSSVQTSTGTALGCFKKGDAHDAKDSLGSYGAEFELAQRAPCAQDNVRHGQMVLTPSHPEGACVSLHCAEWDGVGLGRERLGKAAHAIPPSPARLPPRDQRPALECSSPGEEGMPAAEGDTVWHHVY
jgi:hypothetical protein